MPSFLYAVLMGDLLTRRPPHHYVHLRARVSITNIISWHARCPNVLQQANPKFVETAAATAAASDLDTSAMCFEVMGFDVFVDEDLRYVRRDTFFILHTQRK